MSKENGVLPPSWTEARIRDIAIVNPSGLTVTATDETTVSFIPMASVAELSGSVDLSDKRAFGIVKKGFTRFKNDDLILAKITPSMENGKAAVVRGLEGGIGCGSTEFHVIRSETGVEPDYLRHFVTQSTFRREAKQNMQGAVGQQRVPADFIRDAVIPVAPSLEQQRIVSRIEELFSSIDEGERALERVRKLVERYRQSVLKAAVTGELTREWREQHAGELESGEALLTRILEARRKAWETAELAKMTDNRMRPANDLWKKQYKEPRVPDTAGYRELPTSWSWATLPMLCGQDSINGISVKGTNAPPGIAALRLDAITANGFDYSAIRYIPISQAKAARLSVCTGDFFISRANGSIRLVGKAVLANQPPGVVVFPDTMIRYRLLAAPDLRNWLQMVWPSRLIRSQIEKLAKTTAGIHKISQGDIGQIAIPVPSLEEQAEIRSLVELRLSQADRLLQEAESSLKLAASVRHATLKAAFCGDLVPQTSADEPASVLLERIAAERADAASVVSATKGQQNKGRFPEGITNKRPTKRATARKGKA